MIITSINVLILVLAIFGMSEVSGTFGRSHDDLPIQCLTETKVESDEPKTMSIPKLYKDDNGDTKDCPDWEKVRDFWLDKGWTIELDGVTAFSLNSPDLGDRNNQEDE